MRPILAINSTGHDVDRLQGFLKAHNYYPGKLDGEFGPLTAAAVKAYQVDQHLTADGVPGPITWAQMFPDDAKQEFERVKTEEAGVSDLSLAALVRASSFIGVRERGGPNRGPEVEMFIKSCGGEPGDAWCMGFVQYCVATEAKNIGVEDPLKPNSLHCLTVWNAQQKLGNTKSISEARMGDIFIMDFGAGKGHTGFVKHAANGVIETIEGNTNGTGSREGDGVYAKTRKYTAPFRGVIRLYS